MRLLDLSLLFVLKLQNIERVQSGCPVEYTVHPYYRNKCYHLSAQVSVKGNDYQTYCATKGGLRASIHNLGIYNYIHSLTSSNYMTGLLWSLNPITFTWADGAEYVFWTGLPTASPAVTDVVAYVKTASDEWIYEDGLRKLTAVCDITLTMGPGTLFTLAGGTNTCGRVEVFHDGLWGTIYDTSPATSLGVFVCDNLGYDFVAFESSCVTTPGTGKIWLESVSCPANAATIDDCITFSSSWGTDKTDHMKDVQVKCAARTVSASVTATVTVTQTLTTGIPSGYCLNACSTNGSLSNTSVAIDLPKYDKKNSPMYSTKTVYDMRPSAIVIGTPAAIFLFGLVGLILVTDIIHIFQVQFARKKKLLMKQRKERKMRMKLEGGREAKIVSFDDVVTQTSTA